MRFVAKALMFLFAIVACVAVSGLELAPNIFVALMLIAVLQALAIFAHELGHAIAARKCGATLDVFSVGWLEYDYSTRKLGTVRLLDDGDVGGFVAYSIGERELTRRDDAIIAAAGPGANLLLALVALAAALSLSLAHPSSSAVAPVIVSGGPEVTRASLPADLPSAAELRVGLTRSRGLQRREAAIEWLEGIASVLAVLSLGLGLVNFIPFRGSDGDRLWWALSRKRGVRPR